MGKEKGRRGKEPIRMGREPIRMNEKKRNQRIENRIGKIESKSETLTLILTPSPPRVNPRREKGRGRREKGDGPTFIGVGEEEPSRPFAGAGEEDEPRSWLSGLGKGAPRPGRSTAACSITCWGARAPARGPATAPWSLLALARYPLGGCGCAEREESGVDGEEERAE